MKNNILSKALVMGVVVLFVFVSFTGSTYSLSMSKSQMFTFEGNTLYVGGSGPGNYTTIQSAINAASDGDTVFVYDDSSPYHETLSIQKSINLIGENKETTIIDKFEYILITVEANDFSMKHFTVKGGGGGIYGIMNNCIISDNIFMCYLCCVFLQDSSNNSILNNRIEIMSPYDDLYGIGLSESNDNIISGNIIQTFRVGIEMFGCLRNEIIKNTIRNNYEHGIIIWWGASNIIAKNNFIENGNHLFFRRSSYNLYFRNYWDDWSGIGFYKIEGEDKIDDEWVTVYAYDFFPAKKPYDITETFCIQRNKETNNILSLRVLCNMTLGNLRCEI